MPPDHTEQAEQPVALLHLDSDIYSAAIFVLRTLIADGRIVHGSVIVFDELFNYCGFENHESLALYALELCKSIELISTLCLAAVASLGCT